MVAHRRRMTTMCRLAKTEAERQAAVLFIEKWFLKWYGCCAPFTGGDILVAYHGEKIAGIVNLDFRDNKNQFPLEELYDFSYLRQYFPFFDRKRIVQGGRWSATRPNVSRMLLRSIALHCMPKGIKYMIGEVKDTSIKRLEELGIKFVILYGVTPCLDNIPKEKLLKYYLDPPAPHLMLIKMENLL